jgi:hypothetical protein
MTTPNGKDKTLECAVCGKQFSRGHLDLTRHMNGITLQHQFSRLLSAPFLFSCSFCNICFVSEEHLNSHRTLSTCGKSKGTKPIRSFADDSKTPGSEILGEEIEYDLASKTTPGTNPARRGRRPKSLESKAPENLTSPVQPINGKSNLLDANESEKVDASPEAVTVSSVVNIDNDLVETNEEEKPAEKITYTRRNQAPSKIETVISTTEIVTKEILQSPQPRYGTRSEKASLSINEVEVKSPSPVTTPVRRGRPPKNKDRTSLEGTQPSVETVPINPSSSFVSTLSDTPNNSLTKTVECMICGKLFPRGTIDLSRHSTGKLLRAALRQCVI